MTRQEYFKDWCNLLDYFNTEEWLTLASKLQEELKDYEIYPPKENWFEAFKYFNPKDTKVVILGQDPYHGEGEAHGLAFSVKPPSKMPPSLRNIFKEISTDIYEPAKITEFSTDLTRWADQGVLLLNTRLTVRKDKAMSHADLGWENFCKLVLRKLTNFNHIVYLFWGSEAKQYCHIPDISENLILSTFHPSPLAAYRGFFGCRHFSQTNDYLKSHYREEIVW